MAAVQQVLLGALASVDNVIAGLSQQPALWLDASKLTDADDTLLATWPDSTANARNAVWTGADGEIKPSVRTNIQNGLRAVQWKGVSGTGLRIASQDVRTAPSTGWGINKQFTSYVAFKKPSTNTGWLYNHALNSNYRFAFVPWFTGVGSFVQYGQDGAPVGYITATLAAYPLVTTWQIWCAQGDGTPNTLGFVDKNGTTIASGTPSYSLPFASVTFQVGFATTASLGNSFIGHIGEIIIFGTLHDAATRASMLASLRAKWGL